MNNNIFKDIDLLSNDSFVKLKNKILDNINNYNIEFRDDINIHKDITFGVELEFEKSNNEKIDNELLDLGILNKWYTTIDNSLDDGAEISSPILKDYKSNWILLKNVCAIIKKNAIVDNSCGGHIHIGSHILGDNINYWKNFLKIWAAYENIIYRFGSDGKMIRPNIFKFACPVANYLWYFVNSDKSLSEILKMLSFDKNQGISFQNVNIYKCEKYKRNNTLEFRSPNGTLDVITWQNNVNFFIKLLLYCKSVKFDDELVNKRYNLKKDKYNLLNPKVYKSLMFYNDIYINEALELSDLIFDNNLDKLNFVKQYIKK